MHQQQSAMHLPQTCRTYLNEMFGKRNVFNPQIVPRYIKLHCIKSKATDIDNIQITPVKYVIDIICPCLVHIFNLAISSETFPNKMKRAKVSVIFKEGERNNIGNYRPISVLPLFSKNLEKIILCQLHSSFFFF